jgi:FkbM family methyltransferase
MKKKALQVVNSLLDRLGARIVPKSLGNFLMSSAVQRIASHDIQIQTVIDIGASDGKWSLEAMEIFPDVFFFGIDPLQEREPALKYLKEKISKFNYMLCAAGEKDGEMIRLDVARDLDGSTIDGTGGESRLVPVKTIDTIVSECILNGPFLLKFDTHGYETTILNGAEKTLLDTNLIIMEVYNFKITDHALRFHEICIHLENLGFRCYDMAGPMLRTYDNAFWQMDLFFCRSDSDIFSYSQYC